ncbi:choice-of-anchor D domain-containing protein, partial [Thermodesulfitimonas autotrophica]|uniref:choice-of-anchor D domain-containing protein n=1 Tax=Thermodesulfitimonas autotrophica TaxID=1894989 RepID=UPI002FDFCA29
MTGHKPGWLSVAVVGREDQRESSRIYVAKSPDLEAYFSFKNPAVYPGDTLYACGNYFTAYPDDHLLSLAQAGEIQAGINPERVWYKDRSTIWDLLAFTVPDPDLRAYDGKEFLATLQVGPRSSITMAQDTLKLLPFESAGTASVDDQDLMVFSNKNSYIRSAAVGDLNGDGISDLVVGAPSAGRDFGHPVGAVYIKFGPVEGTDLLYGNRVCKALNLERDWDVRILGDIRDVDSGGNTRRIGKSLAIGDLNGDGINDLLIGTTDRDEYDQHRADIDLGYTTTPRHLPGKAYVLYGRADWQREYLLYRDQYDVKFYGDDERELGHQVGAGRIYGQNHQDLVITAPADALNQVPARAYVIQGWSGSLPQREIRLPDDLSLFNRFAIIEGKNYYQYDHFSNTQYIGDGMGKSLAIGDTDGDGLDDIVLGAPQYSQLWSANPWTGLQGALYIFRGGQLSAAQKYLYSVDAKTNNSSDYTAVWGPRIRYVNEITGFGAAVGIVDLNNDGKGEVVAGAPGALLEMQIRPHMLLSENLQSIAQIQESEIGRIYLIDGSNPALSNPKLTADYDADLVVNGSTSISRFGYSLSAADINHDGTRDLLVGAPGRANSPGRVWVLYGASSPLWAGTDGQDLVQLQNRGRYHGYPGHFCDIDYSFYAPVPLEDGCDYLFAGPQPDQRSYPRFGAFVTAGDLNPYVGDDVLIIDPAAAAPGAPFSGMLYIFYEGSSEYWPLSVRPAFVNMPYRDGAQEFVVSGGLRPYEFKWGSCYQSYIGQPPLQISGPELCREDFSLPENFTVEYSENKVSLRVNGAIPEDLRSLWLKVTDAGRATATSSIRFVKPEISVSPPNVDFGEVVLGYTVNRTITVANAGYMDLQIEGTALTGSPCIRLAGELPETLAPGESCTLTAIFAPEAPGPATAAFTITSNDPDEGTLSILLTGTGVAAPSVPDITIIGGNLVFGDVAVGSSVYQDILITNNGSADLYISSVTVSGSPAFALTGNTCTGNPLPPAAPPYPAGTCRVTVTFTPAAEGPAYGTITVESNDPDTPVFQGHLSGNGITPYIAVTPEALDFGSTLTAAPLAIQNSSATKTLTWSIGDGLPAWLAVSPTSGTLGPGETVELAVTVDRPGLEPGVHTGTLRVVSDGGNAAVVVSVTVLPPLILSPASASISLCGGEQVFSVTNGTPPYTFALLGPEGGAVPGTVTLTDNSDGTTTVTVTACGISRETGAVAAEAAFTESSSTWEQMNISLYRRIISGINVITPAQTVSTQCGPVVLTLKATDANGSVGTAAVTLEGDTWSRAYGPAEAFAIEEAADGGYIVAGRTPQPDYENVFDIRITKLSPAGWVEWDKQLGYPAHQGVDEIRRTADGGYILLGGSSKAYEAGPLLVKLDRNGNIEWSEVVNGAISYGPMDDQIGETSFSAVKQTADGGYILGGTVTIYLRDEKRLQSGMLLVKLDAKGTGEWWRFYHQGPQSSAGISDIEETADGGYAAVGFAVYNIYSGDGPLPILAKFDETGAIKWVQTYGTAGYASADFASVEAENGGGYVIAGVISISAGGGGGEEPPTGGGGGKEPPGEIVLGAQPASGGETGGAGVDGA